MAAGSRILLDSCVPVRLLRGLDDFDAQHVAAIGWGDLDDGPLLDAMAGIFDILVTVDRSLPRQQRLAGRPLAVIVLRARSNRLEDFSPLLVDLRAAILTFDDPASAPDAPDRPSIEVRCVVLYD